MDDIATRPNGGIVGAAGRADLWMFLLVTAGLGWLMWPRPQKGDRGRRKLDGARMRRLSRAEHNLRDGEPMAGYGA
ncbi:MAG TPA: hypothetical protein VGF07_03745 [Stellaceae bacterium]